MLAEMEVYQPVDKKGRRSDPIRRRYVVHLRFNDDDRRDVDAWLKTCVAAFGLEEGNLPWKKDKQTGELMLIATSEECARPNAVDAEKNEVPPTVRVGSGSRLRVYVTANPYAAFGGGIKLGIDSYQILELKSGLEDPFVMENGYTVAKKDGTAGSETDGERWLQYTNGGQALVV